MSDLDKVKKAFEHPEDIHLEGVNSYPVPPDPEIRDEAEIAQECVHLPLNDHGNGKRFVAYFGHDTLFVPRVGWFVWNGRCWAQDDDQLEVRRLAQLISSKITAEAAYLELTDAERLAIEQADEAQIRHNEIKAITASKRTDEQRSEMAQLKATIDAGRVLRDKLKALCRGHHSHAKSAGNTHPINNMMREAQVDVYKDLKSLNANKIMFNMENCALYFEEVRHPGHAHERGYALRNTAHARGLYLTKMMQVSYDPDATCPTFEAFLETILPDDDLRAFVQRWFGYSITGLTSEQKLAFLYGSGRNGKSTLLELIARIMGPYAASVPIESLSGTEQRKGSDATPDLVRLPGARLVRASEPERGTKMREALIKQLTGGADILVRRMMQEFVEVTPEFSLTIDGNYKPEIRGTDNGIWRRVLLVPFLVSIPDEDVDPLLPEKLWKERAGIFNWLLEGCRQWLEKGLMVPDIVSNATEEYREDNDPVLCFIQECCEVTGNKKDFTLSRDLNKAFMWWQAHSGRSDPWRARQVFNHFKDKSEFFKTEDGKSFSHDKSNTTGWRGIKLTPEFLQLQADQDAEDQYQGGNSPIE